MIAENASFAAFVLYAALSPFHIWIFAKRHCAYFGDISDSEVSDLTRTSSLRCSRGCMSGSKIPTTTT